MSMDGRYFPAGKLFRLIIGRIATDGRHTAECMSHRIDPVIHDRCRGDCPVAQLVGIEVIAEWESSERRGVPFEGFAPTQEVSRGDENAM